MLLCLNKEGEGTIPNYCLIDTITDAGLSQIGMSCVLRLLAFCHVNEAL